MAEKKGLTCEEAGKLGGAKTRERKGVEWYREIGRKGGKATLEKHGREHFADMGAGAAEKTPRTTGFYQKIGMKGGLKVKELIEAGKRAQQKD